ncbi:MAG: phosphoribosylglycinamide formyltransferase [Chryseolinea sp.]
MIKSKIAVFASGSGSNAEEIFKYFSDNDSVEVVLLLTNNPSAYAITRAQRHGIPSKTFDRRSLMDSDVMLKWLAEYDITHIVLAGFMWLIPDYLVKSFPNRIINIHPALLPKYGGKGMYGAKVHQAVKNAGETETGITIHLVNEKYDEGAILFQAKCKIETSDDAESIAEKIHRLEHASYPTVIESWILASRQGPNF